MPAARLSGLDGESLARPSRFRAKLIRHATARRCTATEAAASVAPLHADAGARYALQARAPPSAEPAKTKAAQVARRAAVRPTRAGAAAVAEGTSARYEG